MPMFVANTNHAMAPKRKPSSGRASHRLKNLTVRRPLPLKNVGYLNLLLANQARASRSRWEPLGFGLQAGKDPTSAQVSQQKKSLRIEPCGTAWPEGSNINQSTCLCTRPSTHPYTRTQTFWRRGRQAIMPPPRAMVRKISSLASWRHAVPARLVTRVPL